MGKHAQPRTGHVCWQSASRRADSGVHHILQRVLPRLLSFPVGGVHAAYPAIIKKVAASMQPQTVAKKEIAAAVTFSTRSCSCRPFWQCARRSACADACVRACNHTSACVHTRARACTRACVLERVHAQALLAAAADECCCCFCCCVLAAAGCLAAGSWCLLTAGC